jgi:hypothetical protein
VSKSAFIALHCVMSASAKSGKFIRVRKEVCGARLAAITCEPDWWSSLLSPASHRIGCGALSRDLLLVRALVAGN